MNIINYPSIAQFEQLVQLKDYRPVTRYEYVRLVRKLAQHFKCDPATLSENPVRQYFLYLRQEKHWQGSAMAQVRVALRSFFREALTTGKDWKVFEELRIPERAAYLGPATAVPSAYPLRGACRWIAYGRLALVPA
jgi:hypothetical protein